MSETIPPQRNIMQYDPQIWAVVDLLIAEDIKQSKFPDFMMPFCALSRPSWVPSCPSETPTPSKPTKEPRTLPL